MNVLAIIPARGGSKGVPDKNLTKIGGKSLFWHAAECLKNVECVSRTVVSTDSKKIADHARELGLEAPFLRPDELAHDETTDWPVFEHCLDWLKKNEGDIPDIIVHFRVTSPFAFKRVRNGMGGICENWDYIPREQIIDNMVNMLIEKEELDSVRSVELCKDTPYKMWKIDGCTLKPVIDRNTKELYNLPRQKIPPVYLQNGYADVARYNTIMIKKSMNGDTIGAYIVDCDHLVDIDQYSDIEIGELLYQQVMKRGT